MTSKIENHIFAVASSIIRKSSRERPADAVLRSELKADAGLAGRERAEVSRTVFGYYRWLRWLDQGKTLREQLDRALDLVGTFTHRPENFTDAEVVRLAVPDWLHDEAEVSPPWARTLQAEPRLWLRARPGQGRALAARLGDCHAYGEGPLADTLEYCGHEDLFRTAEFHAGEFELQDVSSQAVGLLCGPRAGETWWDACAGEGGKTVHFSDLMGNKGLIWASDRAGWRLQNMKRRAARARVFNYRAKEWDGGPKLPTKTKFDGVLVDAPCSGIGTWQKNPHARWTTTQQDLRELSELQKRLLAHSAVGVKPGGKLIYAVCALARAETVEVVETFESGTKEFKRLELNNPLSPGSSPSALTWLRPEHCGGNGMFVAAWTRRQ